MFVILFCLFLLLPVLLWVDRITLQRYIWPLLSALVVSELIVVVSFLCLANVIG